jgi:hypothetical protein
MADLTAKIGIDRDVLRDRAKSELARQGNENPSTAEVDEFTQLSEVEVDPGRAFLLSAMLTSALRLIPIMLDRYATVLRFSSDGLLLPDEPLDLYQEPANRVPGVGIGYATADEIRIPLDRRTALVLHNDASIGDQIIDMPENQIDEFNAATIWNAHGEVYVHPDDLGRLERIELPTVNRPLLHADGADLLPLGVDGLNRSPGRRSPRRFRRQGADTPRR